MTDTPHHPRPPHAPDGMTPEEHAAQLHPARDVSQDVPPSHRPGPERPVRFGDIAVALGFCSAPQVDHAERLQLDHASERGIGEVLVSERSITREQRDEVLGHQRITFVTRRHTGAPGSDMRLGKLAVDKGLIGYAQMVRGLELQAEARDVDGNTPPLGKVLIELGYFNEIDLYTLLQEIGVEVYRCESCRTVFNVIGRMPSRTFCCPVCHSQRVVEAPGQVLDVVGTLRPGGAPLVASATASGSSASASSVSLGTPGVDVAPATTAAQVANHAADLSVRSPLDNVAWPDATDTTFGLDVAMPDVSRADEWDESSSDAPAISTGDQQLADMVRDATAATVATGAAGAAAPAPPDAVSPDASAEELSASDRVWQRAYRQTGHVPRKPSGKVTRQSGKVSPTSRTSRKVRTSTGKFVSLPGHDDSEGFDAASPLITASLPDTLRGARRSIGPYVIHEEIGRGDLGIVFRATHGQTNERVALKVILGGQARRSEYLERLESQSHVLRKLDHPGIARLIDTGRDGGIVYVASEYVEGKSLDRWAAEHWPTLDERVDIVIRLAEALAFAHDLNIVHRDVCPSNVIVDAFGNPRITDFGLPRPMAEDQVATVQGATRRFGRPVFAGTAALVGNPRYMAPEQLRAVPGVVLDGRTDQFALGVLAYEMVTGRHPFADSADTSLVAVLENVIHEEPPLVRQLVQDVPPDLESVIFRTLEKSRDRRYHGCLELAADLQRVILGEPVDAPSQTLFTRLRKQVERHPTRSLSTAVTVLLLFVLFGTWTGLFTEFGKLLRGNDSATHQPTSDDLRRAVLRSLNDAIDRGDMHTAARLISGLPVSVQRNAGEWLAVARFERIHGHVAEARDAIAHASAIEPTFDAAMLAGDLASEAGDVDAALTAWKDAARLEPTRSEPLISQLKTLQRERRFSDLADLAQAATSGAFAESSEMFAWRGLGEGMYNQLDKSRASLARAEELARARLAKAAERSDAEAERLLGELDQARVFWFRALVTMRRGVDDNEARPEELAAAAAELTRAREDLIAALQHDTRHELSGVLGALRTADLQLSRLRIQALSRQRDQELDRVERARLRLDLGQATSALDDVQQVFARDPAAATPEAGILYARALQAVGEDALARRAWAAIPRGTPADPAVFVGYGNFLLRTQTAQRVALGGVATVSGEDARLAAESFTRAMRADPWRVRALIGRARAMLELGYPHEAQRDLEHALAAAADKLNTVDAQLWLGVTAMRAGQRREGRRRLELASAVPERVEDATGALHAAALLMIDDALNGDPIAPARRRFATLRLHVPDVSFALAVEAGALIRMAASWPPPGYVPPAPAP
ncbi:MAG: protein kinase, partial [Planctomycetota bacterium]